MDESEVEALFRSVTLQGTFLSLPGVLQPKYMDWCKELKQKSQHRVSCVTSTSTSTHGTAFSGIASPPPITRTPERGLARSPLPPQWLAAPDVRFPSISQSSEGRVPSELLNNMMEATKEPYEQYEREQRDLANGARDILLNNGNQQQQQQQHLAAAATQSQRVDDMIAEGDGNNDDSRHRQPNHDDKTVEYDNELKREVRRLRNQFAKEAMYYNEQNELYRAAALEAQKYRAECSNASSAMTQLLNQIQMHEQELEQASNKLGDGGGGGGGGGGGEHGEGQAWNGHHRRQRNRGRGGNGGRA